MSKKEWLSFLDRIIAEDEREVVGPQAKEPKFAYDVLEKSGDLRLDHDVTILPPKKYFLPTCEDLMQYSLKEGFKVDAVSDAKPRIIVGMHPYDVVALQQMDMVYLGKNPDDNYKARRDSTIIIASDIINVSERSFAASMGTHVVTEGYDLMITDMGDRMAISEGSEAGRSLLAKYASVEEANAEDEAAVKAVRERVSSQYKSKISHDKDSWADRIEENYDHPVWGEKSKKCLECGSCTLVCPTCFCYDVDDINNLGLKDGTRKRTWDGCLLRDFTLIGSGEVFRESKEERYRHRYNRKGKYLKDRYGFVACVGCGRCATQCLPDIADPAEIFNILHETNVRGEKHGERNLDTPEVEEQKMDVPLLIPRQATIVKAYDMACGDTFFEVSMDDGKPLEYIPGQFVEVSLFGYGEAPISITSPPGGKTFEIVVRAVGDVTNKMVKLKEGDKLGIRGPMGNGFDVEELKGKNLLFIAGGQGIVPLRSLINHVLANREDFGKITILYGCRDPNGFYFPEEVFKWHERGDINHEFTVDKCTPGECWSGNVGVITTIIPGAGFDPKDTTAMIAGPPIMYKFVIKTLKDMGMPDDCIFVDMERRMKCGVGKCGHCQINGMYCCKEGPVFKYSEIKNLPEALEGV